MVEVTVMSKRQKDDPHIQDLLRVIAIGRVIQGGGEYISAQFAALLQLRHRPSSSSVGMQQRGPYYVHHQRHPLGYFWAPRARSPCTVLTLKFFIDARFLFFSFFSYARGLITACLKVFL